MGAHDRAVRHALARLAPRTVPLFERFLAGSRPPRLGPADLPLAAERLAEWRRAVCDDDEQRFARRLAWDGLTPDLVRRHVVDRRRGCRHKTDRWVDTLTSAILFAERARRSGRATSRRAGDRLPFEEIAAPLAGWARQDVVRRLAGSSRTVAVRARAWQALERALLTQLTDLLAPSLYEEFDATRPAGRMLLARLLDGSWPDDRHPTIHYRRFVKQIGGTGLLPFFERQPVLARLVARTLEAWRAATTELIARLDADLPRIVRHMEWTRQPSAVSTIDAALSDPHHGGRHVVVITFDTGTRIVYKPRSLQLDVAFGGFLAWCNQRGAADFLIVRTLDRGSHGWAEFIEHTPCPDRPAVERFYAGAGALLAVLHLLGATDCHHENVVAHGERLALIDAETVMQPHVRAPAPGASPEPDARAWDTVIRTGLLPQWDFSADGRTCLDTSGLGSFDRLQGRDVVACWQHVNTDDMAPAFAPWTPRTRGNLPALDGAPVLPDAFVPSMVGGFERMYRFLIAHRADLAAPIAAFAGLQTRFVARATQHYAALMRRATEARHLRSAADRAILFDSLSRPFLTADERPALWDLRIAEWRALERLDVPYFRIATDGTALGAGDGLSIEVPSLVPALDEVRARLAHWNEEELRHQVALIEGAFLARMATTAAGSDARPLPRPGTAANAAARRDRFVDAAQRLAGELAEAALPQRDGSVSWLTLVHHADADRFQLDRIGDGLYEGRVGIALFLATVDAITGEPRHRDLIVKALHPIRRTLQSPSEAQRLAAHAGIGGGGGLGSVVYALARLADLLDEPALRDDADRGAQAIDRQIARDTWLDVIGGSAGAILGLLALHERTRNPALLATAAACGEHLLRTRSGDPGVRAWRTFAERPLTGFAHGAAGIALALLRLHAATGDGRYRDAAREAVAYERGVYSAAAGNWPDYRSPARTHGHGHSVMWCHGAPGVGLARLGGLTLDDDVRCEEEIDTAIATTMAFGLRGPDYPCCGSLGRTELLLEAGRRLDRPALCGHAASVATAIVSRARREGGFRLLEDRPARRFKPGLFRGAAGVGYQLLRIAAPERTPSVLLWA